MVAAIPLGTAGAALVVGAVGVGTAALVTGRWPAARPLTAMAVAAEVAFAPDTCEVAVAVAAPRPAAAGLLRVRWEVHAVALGRTCAWSTVRIATGRSQRNTVLAHCAIRRR